VGELSRMGLPDELMAVRLRYSKLQAEERNIMAGTPTQYPVGEDTTRTAEAEYTVNSDGNRVATGRMVPTGKATVTRKMETMSLAVCHQLMAGCETRIANIEKTIAELASAPRKSDDPYEDARTIRDALKGMASLTGGEVGEAAYEPDGPKNGNGNGNGNGKHG